MVTTQGKAVAAFATLNQMARKPMHSLTAYKLFRLKKAVGLIVEFQSEQERKLIHELGGTVADSGAILIDDKEKRIEYAKRHKELEELECDVNIEKMVMHMKEVPEIAMADMETLEEFIEWKE